MWLFVSNIFWMPIGPLQLARYEVLSMVDMVHSPLRYPESGGTVHLKDRISVNIPNTVGLR